MKLFIAIDDTDNLESIGTGRLSRMLAAALSEEGLTSQSRITRHQLLVHPDIPYTSHNSSACIDTSAQEGAVTAVWEFSRAFLQNHFHEGANPGLCVCRQDEVPSVLPAFGARAQQEVIPLDEAKRLARSLDCLVTWSGETGQGCIGAMSAVGLRSTNNDGSYIGLEGIREIEGMMSVEAILRRTPIDLICDPAGNALAPSEMVDTQNWVRPVLRDGRIVLDMIRINGHWRARHEKKSKKQKR